MILLNQLRDITIEYERNDMAFKVLERLNLYYKYGFETDLYPLDLNQFSAILKNMYSIVLQIIFHKY